MDAPPGFGGAAAPGFGDVAPPGFGDVAPPGFGGVALDSPDTCQALALLKELDLKVTEDSVALMPAFLSTVKHDVHVVVRQSIATGMRLFYVVLEKMALQLDNCGTVERWLEEMWGWMVKFKDAMYDILKPEPGPVGIKILAVKFLEAYLLVFTSEADNIKMPCTEGRGKKFSLPFFTEGNSLFNPSLFASEAKGILSFLFDILQSASSLHGSLIIVVINCLTAIARNSPVHYNRVLSVLLNCDSNLEILERAHAASIRFSLRTSLLRFLKCTHPVIIESRDELLKALRAMNPGEATEQIIRRLEKIPKGAEHYAQDLRLKGDSQYGRGVISKKPPAETDTDFVQENVLNGVSLSSLKVGGKTTEIEKMMSRICSLMAQGEHAAESLDFLISTIDPELMADIVIHNMKLLPKSVPTLYGRYKDLKMDLHGSTSRSQQYAFAAGSMAVHVPNNSADTKRDGRGFSARVYNPRTR